MKILAFGEVMMRLMCEDHKLLTQTDHFYGQFTGTGVNVCAGLYQMGEDVYLATTLPQHRLGKSATAHLRKLGIKDDYIRYVGDHMGIYFLEQGIGNRSSYVTYLNRKDSSFGLADASQYDMDSMLIGMDAIHICGISLAMSEHSRICALTFAKKAKALGVKVFFDCNYRASLWADTNVNPKPIYQEMAQVCDVLFASARDGELLGIETQHRTPKEILLMMQKQFQIEAIFGTNRVHQDGYEGYLCHQHKLYTSDQYKLTVFDRIGGGDAFAAGAIYAYLHGLKKQEMIVYATASGVLGHTTYGDSPVMTRSDIEQFIENGPKDIIR